MSWVRVADAGVSGCAGASLSPPKGDCTSAPGSPPDDRAASSDRAASYGCDLPGTALLKTAAASSLILYVDSRKCRR